MKKYGKGIAAMFYPIGGTSYANAGSAFIKVNPDGTAILYVGTTEIGQGSVTAMAQIAAEELGIKFEDVAVVASDTKLTPFDFGPGASRTTYILGNAVQRAAAKAKEILLEVAAEDLQVSPSGLAAKEGYIYVLGFPERRIAISQVADKAQNGKGRPPIGAGTFNPVTTGLDKDTGHGKPFGTYVFATQIAEVEVDTETGVVEVLRITAVHDCGKAINPLLTEGQVEGGVAMGLGFGLMEQMVVDHGRVKNPQLTDYIVPTAMDVPTIITKLVERPEPTGAFGAKGIGEPSLLPTAPAIVNAIQDAVGVRLRDLPVTPEKVLQALEEKAQGKPYNVIVTRKNPKAEAPQPREVVLSQ
jgi:CO/xanthine dehydrogenase Mo-binding subunit